MRALVLLSLSVLLSCGGAQKKQCFECGLSDEWARAEAEERERTNAVAPRQGEPAAKQERNDAATTEKAPEKSQDSPKRPTKRPCGLRSTAQNPDPCGITAGQINANAAPEEPHPSKDVRDKPGYCGQPNCGKPKGLGDKALELESQGYESEWDRPDYCGTPGCGQKDEGKRPVQDSGIRTTDQAPL